MYKLYQTNRFKKSLTKLIRRNANLSKLKYVVDSLQAGKTLERKYNDHALKGEYLGYRECHVEPDLLLVYKIEDDNLILILYDTGSHSDLF